MSRRLEYRIMWDVGGPGEWAPIEYAFDHRRIALETAGKQPDGKASIWVGDATNVEFRWAT